MHIIRVLVYLLAVSLPARYGLGCNSHQPMMVYNHKQSLKIAPEITCNLSLLVNLRSTSCSPSRLIVGPNTIEKLRHCCGILHLCDRSLKQPRILGHDLQIVRRWQPRWALWRQHASQGVVHHRTWKHRQSLRTAQMLEHAFCHLQCMPACLTDPYNHKQLADCL